MKAESLNEKKSFETLMLINQNINQENQKTQVIYRKNTNALTKIAVKHSTNIVPWKNMPWRMELNNIFAQLKDAENDLLTTRNSEDTSLYILEKDLFGVKSAERIFPLILISKHTWEHIQEKNHIIVNFKDAINDLLKAATWLLMKKAISH